MTQCLPPAADDRRVHILTPRNATDGRTDVIDGPTGAAAALATNDQTNGRSLAATNMKCGCVALRGNAIHACQLKCGGVDKSVKARTPLVRFLVHTTSRNSGV